jgi:hypothetical protein
MFRTVAGAKRNSSDNAVGQTGRLIIVVTGWETFVGYTAFAGSAAESLSAQELQGLREWLTLWTQHPQDLVGPDLGTAGRELQDGVSVPRR